MSARRVMIVQTGVANTASIAAAFRRCDVEPTLTADPADVASADLVVLPGVGAFGAGMEMLQRTGLDRALIDRISGDRPTLAVCLGMQLLGRSSGETPGVEGLGITNTAAERFPPSARIPQFGWNTVAPTPGCAIIEPGHAYFANSYRITDPPEGWSVATADHAGPFIAAMQRGRTLACQFHPELSGAWGLALLRRWLALVSEEATAC